MSVPEDFADLVRDRFLRQRGDADITVLEDHRLAISVPGRPTALHDLHNLWRTIDAFTASGPQDLTGAVDAWVKQSLVPHEEPEDLATSLRAVVRHIDVLAGLVETSDAGFPAGTAVPGTATLLVADLGPTLRYVRSDDLERAGLSVDAAFEQALDNTWAAIEPQLRVTGDGPIMLTCGGNFEASLLLFSGPWDRLEEELGQPVVAACPARDLVFCAGADDTAGIAKLEELVQDAIDREVPHLLSEHLYQWEGGSWRRWRGPHAALTRDLTLEVWTAATARKTWPDAEYSMLTVIPGIVGVLRDGPGKPLAPADIEPRGLDIDDAYEAVATRRVDDADWSRQGDPVVVFRDSAGPIVEAAPFRRETFAALETELGGPLVVGFPSRHKVLVAPEAEVGALREQVEAAFAAAGEDALTPHLFRVTAESVDHWPHDDTCTECEARVSPDAKFCWQCGEGVLDGWYSRWLIASIGVGLALSAGLWAAGWVQHPVMTTLMVWFQIAWIGWPLYAVARGSTLGRTFAVFMDGTGRWLLALTPLIVVYQAGFWWGLVTEGPADDTGSALLGWSIRVPFYPALLGVWLAALWAMGTRLMLLHKPYPRTH